MPVNGHLQWMEIRDFTAGLWNVGDQLMPPNAAQTMIDCFPLKTGGLRAWYKPTSFTTTGIDSTTDEIPKALFAHERLINRSGNGTGTDWYLITYAQASTQVKVYRMDQTAAGPPVVWTKIKTHAAGLQPNAPLSTANYVLTNGDRLFCYALGAAGSGDSGVWSVRYADQVFTQLLNSQQALISNYQSRLIAAKATSGIIQFSDPGVTTNIGTNTAPVDISEGQEFITSFATFSPGDLIVFKAGAPIYLVEGDLNNYTVRQMNGSKIRGIGAVRGPDGVIFLALEDGIYVTPDGSQVFPLSKALKATTGFLNVPLVFQSHWLFTGKQGLILDTDTGAWFQTSFVASSTTTPILRLVQNPGFMYADATSPFTLWQFTTVDGDTTASSRAESFTWKSAPLRDPAGRQIEIREINVQARSSNGATSSIAVTVNGVTQTVACDSSGRGMLTFYFMARREELDVQVVSASNASGVEAPRIEVVRVGSQPGHYLQTGADIG